MRLFLHVLFLSSEKEGPKGQGIPAERKQAVGAASLRPVPFSIFRILLVGPEVTSREWFLLRHRASYFMGITSYNIVTVIGTAASRVYFHLKAEAVRMRE